MSKQEQCDGCLAYYEYSERKEICPECEEKLATYDIILHERNSFELAIRAALKSLDNPNLIPEAKGRLNAALKINCISCPKCNNTDSGRMCAMHEIEQTKSQVSKAV